MIRVPAHLLLTVLLLASPALAAGPVTSGGWYYEVVAEGLPAVDNVALDRDGTLYATQELARGQGRLVRIESGEVEVLMEGLDRADGLFAYHRSLYLTEEVRDGRVIEYDTETRQWRELLRLNKPEGIGVHPSGGLVVSEDIRGGRVVHFMEGQPLRVLADGLDRPEGLVVMQDGRVLVAETGTGRVLEITTGGVTVLVDSLTEPDQLRLDKDGGLWITEDSPSGRLLQHRDGELMEIMGDLNYPQGMWFDSDGGLYLAEQGARRILHLGPNPDVTP